MQALLNKLLGANIEFQFDVVLSFFIGLFGGVKLTAHQGSDFPGSRDGNRLSFLQMFKVHKSIDSTVTDRVEV
jgi:hypothetical protein